MKNRGLKNPFSDHTRQLFAECYECWWCGQNHADCLHHILKRVSNSPLNVAPIRNNICHLYNAKLHKPNVQKAFLKKTLLFLRSINYNFTQKDMEFVEKYKLFYE